METVENPHIIWLALLKFVTFLNDTICVLEVLIMVSDQFLVMDF